MNNFKKLSVEGFVCSYKAAYKTGLNKLQLAKILDVQVDSIRRRRLVVKRELGLDLPDLKEGKVSAITQDKMEKFYGELSKLQKATDPSSADTNISGFSRYVVVSAQNATPVHAGFFTTLLHYCEINDARLIVVPYRYKNPTSIWTETSKAEEYWSPQLKDYLLDKETRITDKLVLLAQIKIQPTAVDPLSGFEGYTGSDSAILGHPKVQLRTVPSSDKYPKFLVTTGSVTVPNYTDSKAGYKGEFHHSLAALIVEVEDSGDFHIRHVHGDDIEGSFYDLDKFYTPTSCKGGQRVAAIVKGDTHVQFIDDGVFEATYTAPDSMANVLNPEVFVYHDILDFYNRNHHHRGDALKAAAKHFLGRNNVEEELQEVADFIDVTSRPETLNVIVKANHDEALDRWLKESDASLDPENARFYHYMRYHQYKNIKMTETGFTTIDPFAFWCLNPDQQRGLRSVENTVFLRRDQSFCVNGVEVGFHGDIGVNGTRGSIKNLSKVGQKLVVGHSHSPGIYEGCYQVGVSARLDLEYKKGPSTWMHTHCVIYPDGKRTLINIINGKWKL